MIYMYMYLLVIVSSFSSPANIPSNLLLSFQFLYIPDLYDDDTQAPLSVLTLFFVPSLLPSLTNLFLFLSLTKDHELILYIYYTVIHNTHYRTGYFTTKDHELILYIHYIHVYSNTQYIQCITELSTLQVLFKY